MKTRKLLRHLGGAALGLCIAGGAYAADSIITDDMISGKDARNWMVAVGSLDVLEAKAQLDAAREKATAAGVPEEARHMYSLASAAVYARTDQTVSYAQIVEKYVETAKAVGLKNTEPNDWDRVVLGHSYFLKYKADTVMKEMLETLKDKLTNPYALSEYATVVYYVTNDVEQADPWFRRSNSYGMATLAHLYAQAGRSDKATQIFWEQAFSGKLAPALLDSLYQSVIAYEYGREDFDPEQLKTKLRRAISIYKIKARAFKPKKEGEVNPWLNFIGAMQDTLKDLNS